MNKIDEFNRAIEVLKAECVSHESCEKCAFCDEFNFTCRLYGEPAAWEQLKEQK